MAKSRKSAPRAPKPRIIPKVRAEVTDDSGVVRLHYSDGVPYEHDSDRYAAEIRSRLQAHGLGRRLVAAASKATDTAHARVLVGEELARLEAGQWGQRQRRGPRVSLLAQAVARIQGSTPAEAHEFVKRLSKTEKGHLVHSPRVRLHMAYIRDAQAHVDPGHDLLLSATEGGDPPPVPPPLAPAAPEPSELQ